mmetsp:Transcript_828/g.2441  ORF Transcript_828/g.2441 Transcript_828/m.2441 type:complete len:207 (+) Transcript_828:198-818(+)
MGPLRFLKMERRPHGLSATFLLQPPSLPQGCKAPSLPLHHYPQIACASQAAQRVQPLSGRAPCIPGQTLMNPHSCFSQQQQGSLQRDCHYPRRAPRNPHLHPPRPQGLCRRHRQTSRCSRHLKIPLARCPLPPGAHRHRRTVVCCISAFVLNSQLCLSGCLADLLMRDACQSKLSPETALVLLRLLCLHYMRSSCSDLSVFGLHAP